MAAEVSVATHRPSPSRSTSSLRFILAVQAENTMRFCLRSGLGNSISHYIHVKNILSNTSLGPPDLSFGPGALDGAGLDPVCPLGW